MKYTYEQVEKYLLDLGLLRFQNTSLHGETVKDLVANFFEINKEYRTVNAAGETVCYSGRRRSIGDIFRICKSYNKDVTLEQIQDALLDLCAEQKVGGLICPDINKRVWRKDYQSFYYYPSDEFGFDYTEKLEARGIIGGLPKESKEDLHIIEIN